MLVRNGFLLDHRRVRLIAGLIVLLTAAACGGGGGGGGGARNNPSPSTSAFTTNFPQTEIPIDGGIWQRGLTEGLDWNNPQTLSGKATAIVQSGLGGQRYNDSIAHLKKSFEDFADNQYAQGTVYVAPGYTGNRGYHEIELLLRFETTPHGARGYEILIGITGYIAIVRWNGPVGNYTALYDPGANSLSTPMDGDVFRAQIDGNIITVYRNGALINGASVDITAFGALVWTEGQPGIGFWPVDGAIPENFGWKSFEAGHLL